jgi:hypothetical protein
MDEPSPTASDPRDLAEIRWAPRVNPSAIRRLYETDARGIVDEEQIDAVGYALYARCRSILRATAAQEGRVTCPRCEHVVDRDRYGSTDWDRPVRCERCGWCVRWRDYLKTYQHKHLVGGGAVPFHRDFVAQFEGARTPREKMLAIDRLIHVCHWELKGKPGRSAARELIYARNNVELLTFLDRLALGPGSTPGLQAIKAAWEEKLARSAWHQMTGFRPREQDGTADATPTGDAGDRETAGGS